MYLKTLELHGFKSFPNRTVLTFEKGTTVVVGPNGSGKSNISDAMRWVLGELSSRNIRGTKMEDVIFGGTDDRRPMGFAEVSVTFDNTDKEHALNVPYDEVVVTRRYYRAGDSEYFINRKPCRLKDIYELFLNTGIGREGYSIIGQGKIAEILSKKSEDRRNFFEEAAGIAKFRFKKEEAEKKLADTETNMVRVRDILGELETRVGPLKRESEKARRYLELRDKKKEADVSLWLYDTEKLRREIAEATDACSLSENELRILTESIASLEAQTDRLDEAQKSERLRSERMNETIRDITKNISELDKAYEIIENNTRHSRDLIAESNTRIGEINQEILTVQGEKEANDAKKEEALEKEAVLKEKHLSILSAQQKKLAAAAELDTLLADKLQEWQEKDKEAVDIRVRINVLQNTQQEGSGKTESLESEIANYHAEEKGLEEEAKRCEENASGFKKQIAAYEATIEKCNASIDKLTEERESLDRELSELRIQFNTAKGKAETLQRMEEHFEGYQNSVRFVMQSYEQKQIRGAGVIYGPLSKLISTEETYTVAIETALGANIQNIVADNDTTVKAAIAALRDAHAGRATFYPISAMHPMGETEEVKRCTEYKGYIGRADKMVKCEGRFREIVESLLMRTVVFDTLDNAADAAKALHYRVKLVTLDGQVINAGGSFTGGSQKRDSGIMSRSAEIEKLLADAKETGVKCEALEKKLLAADSGITASRNDMKDAEQAKELMLTMSRAQFAALDTANAKLEANRELTAKLEADLASISNTGVRCEEELAEISARLAVLQEEEESIRSFRAEKEVEKNALLDEKDALVEEGTAVQVEIAEVHAAYTAAIQFAADADRRIAALNETKEAQKQRILEQEAQLTDAKSDMQANRSKKESANANLATVDSERNAAMADTDDYEKRLNELNAELRLKHNQKELSLEANNRNQRKKESLTEKYDRLSASLYEDYELTSEEARALPYPPVTAQNHAAVAEVQNDCRQKMRAMGSVNVSAIEEYDQVKDRYETLSAQVEDMNHSYVELTDVLTKIETEMKDNFLTAFHAINDNFGMVFKELFGGGQAELSLSDPEDVLNCGIEVKAAPPGKIIKSLGLLSGGEQAFVACALFFAILKVNPTPFCLLDEIEAALDDVNVRRLGEYIRKFCYETQFIMITHRRGTMQIADRLYGVTMPERGISRIIALDVNAIEKADKEFTDGLL